MTTQEREAWMRYLETPNDEQPKASFGNDGDAVWPANTDVMWVKVNGAWVVGAGAEPSEARGYE